MNTRIELQDTLADMVVKMSEGNPGAVTVCAQMLRDGGRIDPDDAFGGMGKILSLDTLGLYGSKIWMLYKDVCDHDLPKMLAVLRGWQLGYVTDAEVRHAVDNRGAGIDLPEICAKVSERLPRFQLKLAERPNDQAQ